MRFDLYASLPHYREHLLPIWQALPEQTLGVDWQTQVPPPSDDLLLVASYADLKANPNRRCVYVEHGAGQTYVGLPAAVAPCYSPLEITKQHRNVIAFLCPNEEVASRWSGSYDRPAFVVGCPKLDPWHKIDGRLKHEPRTIAITFHWEPEFSVVIDVPELRSGWEHYCMTLRNDFIPRVIADGWRVLCHWHPRLGNRWQGGGFEELGVECVPHGSEILDRASILIADNTSLSAEMMSLGRGVVWLNHPTYRRDVEHGGRFWQWPNRAGIQVDSTEELKHLDLDAVPASTWHPYAYADGRSAERASEALLSLS